MLRALLVVAGCFAGCFAGYFARRRWVLGAGVLDGAFAPADADAGATIFRQICWKQICRCQHWRSRVDETHRRFRRNKNGNITGITLSTPKILSILS
jgi:hypothetical protein